MTSTHNESGIQQSSITTVIYTETAQFCAKKIAGFLRSRGVEAKTVLAAVTKEFEDKVTTFPGGCPISPLLSQLGCMKYRECNTTNGYRLLYSLNAKETEITVHAILSQREDVSQLLFTRMIER